MRQINRYIMTSVFKATLVAMVLLLGLETFFAFVNEIRYVGTGDYSIIDALTYLIFQIPQRLYQMFPMSALLGSIMGLGMLASSSELVAMRAAGVSYLQIMRAVFQVGFIMVIIVWCVGEFVAPLTDRVAQNQRAFALSGGQALMTEQGTWMRDGADFIHIHSLHVSGFLEGVTRYQFDDGFRLKKATFAAQAERKKDHWILYNVKETTLGESGLSTSRQSQLKWYSSLDPEVLRIVGMKYLDQLSLVGLIKAIEFRSSNGLEVSAYRYALWEKCVQPIVVLVMMLLGISTIFGPLRNANFSLRMLMGILMGFGFFIINASLGPISVLYGVPPALSVMLPSVIVTIISTRLLRKLP
ncbi:MAG: LPS export ABC transporter permease LptG [Legionellales bacterium]|nr:LPS export ABC transporter permease LptG [Legionellales bacterium]|tara:strand:+ start:567 stop:1634 length:1068 start_codon:yes stop_codon:yes gene_type:complete